jgi:Fe-S cluster assembly protein SufB
MSNFSQCDLLLMGDNCGAIHFHILEKVKPSAKIEHEATTSKIGEDQVFIVTNVESLPKSNCFNRKSV